MSEWARENPEEYERIAALPPSEQNAALLGIQLSREEVAQNNRQESSV